MDFIKTFQAKDSFWKKYQTLVKEVVIPYQEKVLKDEIPGVEKSHAIANFVAAGQYLKTKQTSDTFYGMVFQDSDVAKWLEAAAYSLYLFPDEALEKECDEIIDVIGNAQHTDGYLNTYFTVKEPGKRWTNLREAHELYCAGHMMEAAVAYATYTGKEKLLQIMCKMADHMYTHFIEEKAQGYPGHPEVELALLRMYDYTKKERYLALATHFIDSRGVQSDFFEQEYKKNTWSVWGSKGENHEYAQNHLPVREQTEAVGHAVRAVYLYTAMADAAKKTKDKTLADACKTLWKSITQKRMYITGGIGSAYEGEAFTKDYHLPNDSAYAETCASVGLIFFAKKMLQLEKNGKYADVLEQALYNCVLAGMELDGTKFFYVNPLEVVPTISGEAASLKHSLPQRPGWFSCACCPPNVARLLESLYEYAFDYEDGIIYFDLYLDGVLDLSQTHQGKIEISTKYPYEDEVEYHFLPQKETMEVSLAIRIPAWSETVTVLKNEEKIAIDVKDGYVYLKDTFSKEDTITLKLDMKPICSYANTNVASDSLKLSVSYGPLVYCAEGADNKKDVLSLVIKQDTSLKLSEFLPDKLGGIKEIYGTGY